MDAKVLFDTPHRSVHWALVSKFRAKALSERPSQCFDEWKKLLSWDTASKTPHVFYDAIGQMTQLALSGRVDVQQTARAFADLVAVPMSHTNQVSEAAVASAACQALVRLLVAGADSLVYSLDASPRDNILRSTLERHPLLWEYVLESISNFLNPNRGVGADSSDTLEFDATWGYVSRFLRYAFIDPTVPAWAQSQAMHIVFDAMKGWTSASLDTGCKNSVLMLKWAVDVCSDATGRLASVNSAAATIYCEVDMVGRWTRRRLLVACANAAVVISDALPCSSSSSELDWVRVFSQVVDQLRLLLVSLVFCRPHSVLANSLADHGASQIVPLLARLTRIAHTLESNLANFHSDMVLWFSAASQLAEATTRAELDGLLDIIEATLRNKVLSLAMPTPVLALARFPLMCTAADGFSQDDCSRALRLCEDIDQMAPSQAAMSVETISQLQQGLLDVAATQWVTGQLAVSICSLCDYLAFYSQLYAGTYRTDGDGAEPLERVFKSIEPISSWPVLVAPLLFEWSNYADSSTNEGDHGTLPLIALAHLLRRIPKFAILRLSLLPLFMSALRHPDCPPEFKRILILRAIPSLASIHDAYATTRVVSVVSGLWNHGNGFVSESSPAARVARRRTRCLAIRAWGNVVVSNSRVWRDLKPIFVRFVESTKALQIKGRELVGTTADAKNLDPEYEWAVLVTMRDLVVRVPDRYAEQVLPFVYSLLNFARDSLSASSTALLIDIACTCVESGMAGARSVWTTIVFKPAELWLSNGSGAGASAAPVHQSLARYFKLVATHGEASDIYATFRQQILSGYVGPMCVNMVTPPRSSEQPAEPTVSKVADVVVNGTNSCTRDLFLSAFSAYPMEEILPIVAGSSPRQTIHQLLSQQFQHQSAIETADRLVQGGGVSDILAALMDNEVRFMRRSLLNGNNTGARAADELEGRLEESTPSTAQQSAQQRQPWAASNLERSQWLNGVLLPVIGGVCDTYWDSAKLETELSSRFALPLMIGSLALVNQGLSASRNNAVESSGADSFVQRVAARLALLVGEVSLSDHWCLRNCAIDTWQTWFTSSLRGGQEGASSVSASETVAATAAAGHHLLGVLRKALRTSHIPAHMANALYALAGLVKAAACVDQSLGSELSILAGNTIVDLRLLPFSLPPEEFWLGAGTLHSNEVLAAAAECAGQLATCNIHDQATLGQIAQFLMAGLMLASGGGCTLPSLAVQAIARSLMHLHTALFAQKLEGGRSYSEDVMVVEADDVRRCIERLDVLHSGRSVPGPTSSAIDIGSVSLAMTLAAMHRQWIARLINPAMAEQNATPRASQALRVVAQTLSTAYQNLRQAEDGQLQQNPQCVASLYYLCFVWPPRPITQRHIELHSSLFAVMPDRVWQAATRLVRKLWSSAASAEGGRHLDYINFVELAVATLAYHLAMTTSQGPAHSAHLKLIEQFTGTVRGETDGMGLAANEKPSLRANRAVALAVLLGVPLHGVPDTTVSNEYLPVAQQRLLPALLGVGSVQYGSTAWLRVSESALRLPLGSLLSCSGLARYVERNSANDATADHPAMPEDVAQTSGSIHLASMRDELEAGDERSARVAAFVVGGLLAQSSQAIHLLLLEQSERQCDGAVTSNSAGAKVGTDNSVLASSDLSSGPMAAETSMAASEEPKHLGRLPASSSWCRAVWESIVELSESLADGGGGAVVQSVECKLVYLLTSMLRAARPFPVVDSRKVFERVLGVYMGLADATNIMTRRLPLLAVLLSTADRLSPLSFSMAQFVTDAIQQVVGKAVDISSKLATEHQFIHGADCDTFAAIALGRLGSMGLGRVLRLAGFSHDSGSAAEVAETKGALKTLHATWESSLPIPDRVLQQSATRILGSTALYAKHLLAEAVAMTLSSASLLASLRPAKENVAESDASRMFRIMSKVALPPAKVANTCSSVLAVLFVANSDDLHSANSPLHFSLQAALLSTLQAHIVSMDSSGAAKAAAREKITDEVAHLVQGLGSVSGLQARSSERALLLWAMLGVAYCGANRDRGAGLLKTVPGALTDMEFCKMVEQQALLLCRHISSNHGDGLPGAEALVVDANGALDVWLKGTFKEWARRHHCSGRQAQDGAQNDVLVSIACSMQKVASAVHGSHRIRHGSTEAQRRIIQGLDLVILAASVAGAKSAAPAASADDFIKVGVVCWLLPLLRGAGVQDACCQQSPIDVAVSDSRWLALFSVAMRDMLGHLGRNSGHSQAVRGGVAEQLQPARQYSVQLRTRVLGLLDLARSEPLRRALRLVLAHLALLGMLPPSDLQRVV